VSWEDTIKKEVGEEFKPFENNIKGFIKEVTRFQKSLEEWADRGTEPIPSRADKRLRKVFRTLEMLDEAFRDVLDEV
tara:strand:+ start:421 stop:651 length:231 start_codon:yes stop_codon:yes gene_type:complete